MKSLLALAAVMGIFTMLVVLVNPLTTVQAADVCPSNPSPPNAADPSVIVDVPASGATVTSPVTISGKARGFEANVRITVYDQDGKILTDTFTTAAEAGPTLAPYSANVTFDVDSVQQGCIRVFEESAQDGSAVNVVQVEVLLAPSTTPPSTGDGGLQPESTKASHVALYTAGALAMLGAIALALHRRLWT